MLLVEYWHLNESKKPDINMAQLAMYLINENF